MKKVEVYKEMTRFRNIIVHRYGKIDNGIVYLNVTQNMDDFYDFIEEVKGIIK